LPRVRPLLRTQRTSGMNRSGEGRNRTGDTTVFSRVLYQLSYLARTPKCSPDVDGLSVESPTVSQPDFRTAEEGVSLAAA
jgi:hypothetical protein